MALLHYMQQSGFEVVIAHVNYKKRESSLRDQLIVEAYAKKHNLIYEVKYYDSDDVGNFQKLAREFRYDFYKELVSKYRAKGVALGHHRNDDVETYYMQKKSNKNVMPGMLDEIIIDSLFVWRPLLDKTKDDLITYCTDNGVEYGIDESNYELKYTRNKVRDYLTSNDLYDSLYEELLVKRSEYIEYVDNLVVLSNPFYIKDYKKYEANERVDMLRKWLNSKGVGFRFSNVYMQDLDAYILKGKSQIPMGEYTLSISYGEVMLHGDLSFSYSFEKIEYVENEHFKLSKSGEVIEGVTLSESDFPIVIRSFKKGDKIALRYGTKGVNRFFVDRKIPIHSRKAWVVVENNVKDVVFVMKIGCDVYHYSNNPSVFVIK